MPDFLAELKWRGLFHQCTNEDALRAHLGAPHMAEYRARVKDLVVGVRLQVLQPA